MIGEYLEFHTNISRMDRKSLKTKFTESGQIGETFSTYFQCLKEALTIPQCHLEGIDLTEKPYLSEGFYFIVPSFFHLLIKLIASDVDFVVIFRTFGVDIADVACEYNDFCDGKHPIHKIPNSAPHMKILLPEFTGRFMRTSNEFDGLHFAYVSTHEKVSKYLLQLLIITLIILPYAECSNSIWSG
jgi:hypothetical protein